jgi:hypothetical protein
VGGDDSSKEWKMTAEPVIMIRRPQGVLVPSASHDGWDELPGWTTEGFLPLFQHTQ